MMHGHRYLHDFIAYERDPIQLCGGRANLYVRSSRDAVTITDIETENEDEINRIVEEAQTADYHIPTLLAITKAGSTASRVLQEYPYCPKCVTVSLRTQAMQRAVQECPRGIGLQLCDRAAFSAHADNLADIMHRAIEGAIVNERLCFHSRKPISDYIAELRTYGQWEHFDMAWRAFRDTSNETVGFAMCSNLGDDLGDTLGIGVYIPWEQLLIPVWRHLLGQARARLEHHKQPAQITTWVGTSGHYESEGFTKVHSYQLRTIRSEH